jgi:hypothetical protein
MSVDPQPIAPERRHPGASSVSERSALRRRRALRRLDVVLGLTVGVIWIVFVPGIAIAGIIAVLVLALAGISLLFTRRRRGVRRGRARLPRWLRRRRRTAI